jgi:uncharacterized membrane protein YqjE
VFQDIVRNFQEIVRSEVRLAKTELRDEASKAKLALAWLAGGAVLGLISLVILALAAVYALATVLPEWGAGLLVGVGLAVAATLVAIGGIKRLRTVHGPERTLDSLKENAEWVKHQQSK